MSTSEAPYRARHAAPRRSGCRRFVYSAAVVAAGAVPLAAAGAAHAAAAPLGDLGGELPAVFSLPALNTPISVDSAHLPVGRATTSFTAAQAVNAGAHVLTSRLNSALPLGTVMPAVLPDPNQPLQAMSSLLDDGPLGTLSQGLEPQTQSITGAVVGQTSPIVGQLHQAGLPTVGDVTGQVSQTSLPGVGAVGGLTESLPVTSALGRNSPVTGALNSLSGL